LISCNKEEANQASFERLIAPDATMIIQFEGYSEWKNNIEKQSFISRQHLNTLEQFFSVEHFDEIIDLPEKFLLTYNTLGKGEPLKTIVFQNKTNDSLKITSKTSYEYDGFKINEIDRDNKVLFSTIIDGFYTLSESKIILENIIRNYSSNISAPDEVKRLMDGLSRNSTSVIINTELFSKLSSKYFVSPFPNEFLSLSDHLGFDLKIDNDKIFFSGIAFNPKKNKDWSVFSKVKPSESLVAEVIPNQFVSAKSLMVSDYYSLFPANLTTENPIEKDSLLINIKEVSEVDFVDGSAKIFLSYNIEQTFENLSDFSKPHSEFSSVQIHEIESSVKLSELIQPYLSKKSLKFFFIKNDFVIASEKLEILENIIIHINNEKVLKKNPNYLNHIEDLYGKSHMLWMNNMSLQSGLFESKIIDKYRDEYKNMNFKDHPLIISQLIAEDNFAYLNILIKEAPEDKKVNKVSQQIRFKHDKDIVSQPQFFKNWRTGQYDVVYQDNENRIYLKDTKGNLIWTKKLEDRIIGRISTIDIYQNGRLQMAFATKNKVYIIDKNGNDVSPFPLDFKEDITQALSVFDYDNNGKYRFVVVQDNKVNMYDKEAKLVRGFRFKNTKSPVAFPVKHVRMGNKDYVLIQETSGRLHILSRRGKERVELPKDFRHTENEWFEHDGNFVSVNDKGNILEIDQNGKLNTIKKEWLNPKFDASENHFAEMSENELIINKNAVELPFGLYTDPLIMNKHVGIADLQAQKVYVTDLDGNILEGFPAFGKSINDFYYSGDDLFILCQDEEGAMLVYKTRYN
jgi:hypothetical protein